MGKRIIVGLALTALLCGALYLGGWALGAVATAAAVIAVQEMGAALKARGITPFLLPGYLFAGSYCALYALCKDGAALVFLGFLALLFVIAERILNPKRSTVDCFGGLFVFLYPLPFFTALMLLYGSFPRPLGLSALLLAFAGPLVGDTLAYFVGSLFGRHKLCPAISPKKTVEGSAASLLGGVLGGALVLWLEGLWGGGVPFGALLILGAVCGLLGQIGDLFASIIKRWTGVKDYGSLFPGHGGVLDRLDSVLLCAPVILGYFYYFAR